MTDICKQEKKLLETGKKILLVEGKNDCHVVLALCNHHSLKENFGIYPCGNDDEILRRLLALTNRSDSLKAIGIVIDADTKSANGRLEQIEQKIIKRGYIFPKDPDPDGMILPDNDGKPRVGFWIMPDNKNTGSLEDFLIEMADQNGIEAASDCVNMAKDKGVSTFKEVHRSKAVIHTYLAWQDEPGKPLGQSITAHALKPETRTAKNFINWLERLFSL